MADLDRGLEARARRRTSGSASPSLRLADVGEARLEVAAGLDAAQVPAVAVRAGDELALAQRLVGDDLARRSRPGRASRRSAPNAARISSVGRRRGSPRRARAASFASLSRSSPRTSASTSVPSSFTTGIAFEVAAGSIAEELGERLDRRRCPGVSTSSGASSALGELGRARDAARDLEVGRVVAVLAGDERVLARAGRREEVDRLAAAHHPALRLDARSASSPQRSKIRSYAPSCALEARVEAGLVAVERVRVLHDELADAEQAAARPRLVAVLRLEVVPELRQLPVALELARVEGDRLLVRQRQDELAARCGPRAWKISGISSRPVASQSSAGVSTGASISWPPIASISSRMICSTFWCTRQPSGRNVQRPALDLADEAAADEQLVADRLGVGRSVAQGRQEEL